MLLHPPHVTVRPHLCLQCGGPEQQEDLGLSMSEVGATTGTSMCVCVYVRVCREHTCKGESMCVASHM